ncbi:MAG: hypothetical protein ACM3II_08340 [Rhodospirillaceae bacterium]
MDRPDTVIEEPLGAIIVEGQRCELWLRSEPDQAGTWHNAVLFRRDAKLSSGETLAVGLARHLPPGPALDRARALQDMERLELYLRAQRPRPPLA